MTRQLLVLATFALGLAVVAQPPEDDTFLTITLLTAAGGPCLETVTMAVNLVRAEDSALVPDGKVLMSERGILAAHALTPGPHLVTVTLVDGFGAFRREIDVRPGANALEWRIPPRMAVSGSFTRNGVAVSPTRATAYLMALPERTRRPVPVTLAGTEVRLPDLFPGDYALMLLTDAGHAVLPVTVAAEAPTRLPVVLLPGGTARIVCTGPTGAPLPEVNVRLGNTVLPGFTAAATATTGADGTAIITSLPPGEWLLYAYLPGCQPVANVRVVITAGQTTETAVALKRAG